MTSVPASSLYKIRNRMLKNGKDDCKCFSVLKWTFAMSVFRGEQIFGPTR